MPDLFSAPFGKGEPGKQEDGGQRRRGKGVFCSPGVSSTDPAVASVTPHSLPHPAASLLFPPNSRTRRLNHKNKGPVPGPSPVVPTASLAGLRTNSPSREPCSSQPTKSQHISSRSYGKGGEDQEGFARGGKVLGKDGEQATRLGSTRRKGLGMGKERLARETSYHRAAMCPATPSRPA